MKKFLFLSFLSTFMLFACKKRIETPMHKLIPGLDPSVNLPNADTTGALSYIEGYIDGERFCLVEGKDSVLVIDYASALFGYDYQKDWLNGIGGAWYFQQGRQLFQEPPKKMWYIQFNLPTFGANRDTSSFNAFKRKYATPATFTNLDRANKQNDLEQFSLHIFRTDIYNGEWKTLGLTTWGEASQGVKLDQTGSYIKLVSVGKLTYIPNTNYHYEMIYEFDLKLAGNKHLTKGRMKTWISGLKL